MNKQVATLAFLIVYHFCGQNFKTRAILFPATSILTSNKTGTSIERRAYAFLCGLSPMNWGQQFMF